MKTWLQSLLNKIKGRRRSSRVERTVVEEKILQHVESIIMTACAEFGRSGYAGRSFISNDMSRRMSVLMYRIENHLYDELGNRITLGNTTLCGGSIRTLATGKDSQGYPRAQYKLQLPMFGKVVYEYGARAVVDGDKTLVRPYGKIIIGPFDIVEIEALPRLINFEIKEQVDVTSFGW